MPRVEYKGAIYHVTARMVGQARELGQPLEPAACLFRDDAERARFIEQLGERVEAFGVRLFAYCLMLTHFHLYLETPGANLARFMHSLETAYAVYSNLRRERHGPMLGRYKAKPVEGDSYHLGLSRYVHLNPVRTAATNALPIKEKIRILREYRWSSYRAYVGRDKAPDWLACGPILAFCGGKPDMQRREYRRFVEIAIGWDKEDEIRTIKSSPLAIGSETFVEWIRGQLNDHARDCKCSADTELRKLAKRVPVDRVTDVVAGRLGVDSVALGERRRNSDLRGIAARALCRYAGLTQREVAATLGMKTGAAVGQQLQRLKDRLSQDPQLRRHIAKIDSILDREARDN